MDVTLKAVPTGETGQSEYPAGDLDLTALDTALERLYRTRALIGSMPPAPASARGRVGARLVGVVRRALFWLWPQLDMFNGAVIEFARAQAALMDELREHLLAIDDALEALRRDAARVHPPAVAGDTAPDTSGAFWLQMVRTQALVAALREGLLPQGPPPQTPDGPG